MAVLVYPFSRFLHMWLFADNWWWQNQVNDYKTKLMSTMKIKIGKSLGFDLILKYMAYNDTLNTEPISY